MRIPLCLFNLKRYEECLELSTKYVDQYGSTDKIVDLRKNAREAHLKILLEQRKTAAQHRKKSEKLSRTVAELTKRGIKFEEQTDKSRIEDLLTPVYDPLTEFPIHIQESGDGLTWPAIFCYPELELCDFQQGLEDDVV